jgi:general secretion pathway protein G
VAILEQVRPGGKVVADAVADADAAATTGLIRCSRAAARVSLVCHTHTPTSKEPVMRHAPFAGWMFALGLAAAAGGIVASRLLAAADVPPPTPKPAPTTSALAALQVNVAPNGSLLLFDSSTGEVLRVTTGGDKPAVEPLGTLRKSDSGKWEFVPPAAAAPLAPATPEAARSTAAKADVLVLMTALKTYRNDTGKFPSTEEGLQSLGVQPGGVDNWKGPYVKGEIPKDPWGNPYVYRNPGKHNPSGVDVFSFGPDTRDGGGDDIYAP